MNHRQQHPHYPINEDDNYHPTHDFSSRGDEDDDDDDESFQGLSEDDEDDDDVDDDDDDEMQEDHDDEHRTYHRHQQQQQHHHMQGSNTNLQQVSARTASESQAPRYGLTQHHLHASRPDMTTAPTGQPVPPPVAPEDVPPAPVTEHIPAASSTTTNDNNNDHAQSMDATMDNEPPLDGYERTNRIGQGAYGIVYRGIQRSTGVTVAIKRIPFADAAPEGGVPCNVIREISLLRELDHPNVVRLLDVNQARPGELYLVFEYVAHDLKTFLDKAQPPQPQSGSSGGESGSGVAMVPRRGLPTHLVRSFLRQILEGVGYCHTYRILHRDLKPHNLLISSDGTQVKLADFGLARLSGLPSGPYTSEVVTLWYRAPELLMGATRYCGPVDVWSIGCIFAEMATGYALFPGRSDIDQLFKIFQRRGTPVHEPSMNRLPHYNPDFPKWPARPISDFVDLERFGSSGHAADLLEQLLQYDPEKRLICKQALHHPFFFENDHGA